MQDTDLSSADDLHSDGPASQLLYGYSAIRKLRDKGGVFFLESCQTLRQGYSVCQVKVTLKMIDGL